MFHSQSYTLSQSTSKPEEMEYSFQEGKVITMIMYQFNEHMAKMITHHGKQFIMMYSLKKGIQKFGEQGRQAALKEMK